MPLDTIKIWCAGNFENHSCPARTEEHIQHGLRRWSGRDSNIKVFGNCKGLSVTVSLPKLLKGSNIYEIESDIEIEAALDMISEFVNFDVRTGYLTRCDVAFNILTLDPVKNYLLACGECTTIRKPQRYATGILYKSSVRELTLYDKIAELKSKRVPIPQEFRGRNILRAESRQLKSLNHLGRRAIASDLLDPLYISNLMTAFSKDYEAIQKIAPLMPLLDAYPTCLSELTSFALGFTVSTIGMPNMKAIIEAGITLGLIPAHQKARMFRKLREAAKLPGIHQKNALIEELNTKMRERFMLWNVDVEEKILSSSKNL